LRVVVLATRAGYDPFSQLDVLTSIDSLNPQTEELNVMTSSHPHTNDRFMKLAGRMEGSINIFVSGQIDYGLFNQLASST